MDYSLDELSVEKMMVGFHERMSKLALFEPLFDLARLRIMDQQKKQLDMREIGLLTLLFFFEQKLMRSRKTSRKDYIQFLNQTLLHSYHLNNDLTEQIANKIIDTFRPAQGKIRDFQYNNPITGTAEKIKVSLLRTDYYDSITEIQYYTLDEQGLELVFATKEFYMEFQLSIHQLLLRKQLEKGEFHNALRQIDEMHIDVETLHERIERLEYEIRRSIVSEETFQRYRALLEDIQLRLKRENEEFEELREFVRETRERIYVDRERPEHQRSYQLILQISRELEKVHHEHTKLLQHQHELGIEALRAARESLYYTGIHSFNFEQDVTAYLFHPLPLEALQAVIAPFLQIEQTELWSPLTVFDKHQLRENERSHFIDEGYPDMGEVEDPPFIIYRNQLLRSILHLLLDVFKQKNTNSIQLSELVNELENMGQSAITKQKVFYECWLILHQRSPVVPGERNTEIESNIIESLYDSIFDILGHRILIVTEERELLRYNEDRYVIQNMTIQIEEV